MEYRRRFKKTLLVAIAIVVVGISYLIFFHYTGYGIPCLINKIFNVNCPGCGITRMINEFASFNIKEAFKYNYFLFITLPLVILFILYIIYSWIRYGIIKGKKIIIFLGIIYFILLIIWAIVRNIYGI